MTVMLVQMHMLLFYLVGEYFLFSNRVLGIRYLARGLNTFFADFVKKVDLLFPDSSNEHLVTCHFLSFLFA